MHLSTPAYFIIFHVCKTIPHFRTHLTWLVVLTILKNISQWEGLLFHFHDAARHCARSQAAPRLRLTVQLPVVVRLDDIQGSENLSCKMGKARGQL
jgi:hypothetical protein